LDMPHRICVPARHGANGACTSGTTSNDAATSNDATADAADAIDAADAVDAADATDAADAADAADADQRGPGVGSTNGRGLQRLLWWKRRQTQ